MRLVSRWFAALARRWLRPPAETRPLPDLARTPLERLLLEEA